MDNLGRNDNCHCGSGKKYKKCCLRKDEENKNKQNIISKEEFSNNEDFSLIDNFLNDIDENEFIENEESLYPKINLEEIQKVDKWWDEYKKLKNPNKEKQHLDNFLNNNSKNVILNLGLEHEVLFELINDFINQGKTDEIIPYMIEFRQNYPEVYEKSAGYFDYDIIAWFILKGRLDKIDKFLNYFEKSPIDNIDKLFDTINILNSTNNAEIILPTVKKIYKEIWFSYELIGSSEIIDNLIVEIYSKYLQNDIEEKNIIKLIQELKDLKLDFGEHFYSIAFWKKRINYTMRTYKKWDDKAKKNKEELENQIFAISSNFIRFLHEEIGMTYYTSQFYAKTISEYLIHVFEDNKKAKYLFNFTKEQIDNATVSLSKEFMSINITKAFTILNAIYYFADYLYICGNFGNANRDVLQKITKQFSILINKNNEQIETAIFEKFPFFD